MTKTKHSLLMSVIALILCASMLIGSTFAWFTDSVTSSSNIIKSGTLDITLSYLDDLSEDPQTSTAWKIINETPEPDGTGEAIFSYSNWEPGFTQIRHIKIENKGSLALNYVVNIVPKDEHGNAITDLDNLKVNGVSLADVIDVYYFDPAKFIDERDDIPESKKLGTLTEVLTGITNTARGTLTAGGKDIITLALKMKESAGNDYQNKTVGASFDIQLFATQLDYEFDSIDDKYDEGLDALPADGGLSRTLDDGSKVKYYDESSANAGKVILTAIPENLGSEYVVPSEVNYLGSALNGVTLDKLTIPASVEYAKKSLLGANIDEVVITEGATTIPDRMFYQAKVASIVIPDTVTTIEQNAFAMATTTELTIPASVTHVGEAAFQHMDDLEKVTFEGNVDIEGYAFRGCADLRTVYLKGDDVNFVVSATGKNSCWFCNGESNNPNTSNITFYVENDTVAARLRTALGAENPATTPIYVNGDLYVSLPAVGTSAENCSWEEISAIGKKGKADDYFNLGDTKTVTIDGESVVMELVAFDADEKTDGTKAAMTWISKNVVAKQKMNDVVTADGYGSSVGGWAASELRDWLQTDYYAKLPQELKNTIVTVNKKSLLNKGEWTNNNKVKESVTEDTLWIPSINEINPNSVSKEQDSAQYYDYFTKTNMLERYARNDLNGENSSWWLRSCATSNVFGKFHIVSVAFNNPSTSGDAYSHKEVGVVFGFCI